jgi:hypothetical protein
MININPMIVKVKSLNVQKMSIELQREDAIVPIKHLILDKDTILLEY